LVRSAGLAVAGAGVLFASYFALFAALPRFTPFQFLTCTPIPPSQAFPEGGTSCFSSLNPAYPLVFLLSVAGTVTLLVGWFGRGFIISPVFVIGILALEYGLSRIVSGFLDMESGVTVNPAVFLPFVAIGVLALCFRTYRYLRPRTNEGGERDAYLMGCQPSSWCVR